jgi:hypothetical protein
MDRAVNKDEVRHVFPSLGTGTRKENDDRYRADRQESLHSFLRFPDNLFHII